MKTAATPTGGDAASPPELRGALDAIGSPMDLQLSGGKLLRSRLVLVVAAIGDAPDREQALHFATQIELIHAGALIHDDLMDGSTERRGQPTLWAARGAHAALFTGLALMSQAAAELQLVPADLRRDAAHLIREVARGQTDELVQLYSTTVSPEAYECRAQAKTGRLYELAARLGAAAGRLDARTTDAVTRFSAELGLAFQIADDVRDLVGGPGFGRPPGTDLRVGVYTLPVLATLAGRCRGGERLRTLLAGGHEEKELHACIDLLQENGSIEYATKRAKRLVFEALAHLADVQSMRARVTLERYAFELLGPLHTARAALAISSEAPWKVPVHSSAGAESLDPAMRLLLHPTIPARVRRLLRRFGHGDPLGRAVGSAAGLALLADGIADVSPAELPRLVGAVDLLFAEFWGHLGGLPGGVACVIARRLAGLFMDGTDQGVVGDESLAHFAAAVVDDAARANASSVE